MKNLKKLLAMVLVVAMSFSFVTFASAKFTDDSTIKYGTAVGVMTGIGAINGYADGSFKPADSVTRAEAAKMVAYAILGPQLAGALPAVTSTFKDVPSTHWASKYIQYLVSLGIISGRGDGTFDPNGKVTAVELSKLLLCSAGYGKNNEYVGTNWSFQVVQDAYTNNVFAGSAAADYTKAATREEAALYIYNAIMNIVKVQYSKTNDVYTAVTGSKTIAMATYNMAAVPAVGIVTGNAATGVAGTAISQATLTGGKITALATATTYTGYTTVMADIGKVVTIYANTITGAVYYMAPVSTTVNVALPITTATGYATAFGTANDAAAVVNATANYVSVTPAVAITGLTHATAAAAGTYQLYAGEIVSYVAPSASSIQKVVAINTTAGSETITFTSTAALANNATTDVVNAYEGIAVGNYVQITQAGTVYNVEKVTTVQGTVSEVGAGNTYIVLGGVKYYATTATNTSGLTYVSVATADYGKTVYTLYLDAKGNAIGTTTADSTGAASSVVYVVGAGYQVNGNYGLSWAVQCVDSTGKEVIYSTGGANPGVSAGFYKVTVTNGIAVFAGVTPATDLAIVTSDTAVSKTDYVNGSNYYYATEVQFIFVTGSGATLKVEKVTGLAAADGNTLVPVGAPAAFLYFNQTTSSNKTVSTVIVPTAYVNPTATGTATLFVPANLAYASTNANGYVYNVYIDGVATAITSVDADLADVDSVMAGAQDVRGKFATYSVNSSTNVYDFTAVNTTSVVTGGTVAVSGVFGGYITVGGETINASAVPVIDLSQAPFVAPVYTSVAAMEAVTASRTFTVSYAKNALTGAVIAVYVTANSNAYTPAAVTVTTVNGLSGTVTSTQSGNDVTYTLVLNGTASAASTITLANSTWMATIPVFTGVTRTSGTVLGVANGTVLSNYTVTFTVTLTANNTPAPTVVIG